MKSHCSFTVFVSDRGNVFMTELGGLIADSLSELGREVSLSTEGLPRAAAGHVNLVVAPHEYFTLLPGCSQYERLEGAAASVSVTTEQPGTTWFDTSARFAQLGPLALDINERGAAELRRRGIRAAHLPLGYHSSLDRWQGSETAERPRDVLFLGARTPRREAFLGRAAHLLWDYSCELRLFDYERPVTGAASGFVAGSEKYDLLGRSKVLLNIHRDELSYFEWVRVLEAMANGCVVISETSTDLDRKSVV